MNQDIMNKIDKGCMPTINKYIKEQLIGAIFNFITESDASSFCDDYDSRKIIEEVGVDNFIRALLEHIIKLDALIDIKNKMMGLEFSPDYQNHNVDETELRMIETLSLSVDDVINKTAITDALYILAKDGVALYNVIQSFVEYRYVKAKITELDTTYLKSDEHKRMMWKIDEYYKAIN